MKTIHTADMLDLYSRFIKASQKLLPDMEWRVLPVLDDNEFTELHLYHSESFHFSRSVVARVYMPLPADGDRVLKGDYWYIQWDQNMEAFLKLHPELKNILEPYFTGTFK